jgi:hypothetical protein
MRHRIVRNPFGLRAFPTELIRMSDRVAPRILAAISNA